ncbi:unnamed protein product [Oikopleura dioica]|uniref:Ig-like domain-containing protein n=1 Tax=Oikopleura dioica TaxID=34765 RepID=E4XIB4_OIKDI|nr:unnamed protein product [Oikopleura dioica]
MSSNAICTDQLAPVIVGEPVRRTVADESGLSIAVECPILGNPEPRYTWIKDDNTVHTTTSKTHSIERISQKHAGNYRCIGRSDLGSAEATVQVAIKGPPTILSTKEQFGMELECAFVSEPKPSHVRIVDLGKSEDEGIIHELFGDAVKNVKINAGVGQFECLVENELGTSTSIIRLQPEGITAQAKFGIVFGILGFGLIFCLALCIKLRWFPREQQLKINNSDFDNNSRSERAFNYDPVRGYNPSLNSSQLKNQHLKVHSSSDEVFLADEIPSSRNVRLGNSLGINNAETASTERSHHDDGYGTESGSNQKVNTMSDASESNSDYEVHVASLSSAAGVVPNSDKSSKICVIWDDASSSYNPSQIRAHTAALQSKINRARSVSHV